MHYTPHVDLAFVSVEHIMRDVNNGWLIRYLHANGASMFFIVVYCHIFRGLYFGSYYAPRHVLWFSGVLIFFLMMATAFMGYVLPWGQMSFWGATVITNLFSAIPFIGSSVVEWLWGGFSVDNATLNRFFSLHYLMPFVIAGLTIVHLSFLHYTGSNNPLGLDEHVETVSFYPYFYVKDFYALFLFIFFFSFFFFYYPNVLGHSDNYIPANSLVTPAHIVPEWYFLPFYAILRSIPNKLGGVLAMVCAILILLILPFIVSSRIKSSKFRPVFAIAFWFLVSDFVVLGWIGQKPVEDPYIDIGMNATNFYFFFLIVLIPLIGWFEKLLFLYKLNHSYLLEHFDWPVIWFFGDETEENELQNSWNPAYEWDHYDCIDVEANFFDLTEPELFHVTDKRCDEFYNYQFIDEAAPRVFAPATIYRWTHDPIRDQSQTTYPLFI